MSDVKIISALKSVASTLDLNAEMMHVEQQTHESISFLEDFLVFALF